MKKSSAPRIDLPGLKKNISLFSSSKENRTLKKDILKMGLTAMAVSAVIASQAQFLQAANQAEDGAAPVDEAIGHSDAKYVGHSSKPAPYDEVCKCGGHASTLEWQHADSASKLK